MKKALVVICTLFLIGCSSDDEKRLSDGMWNGRGGIYCEANGLKMQPNGGLFSDDSDCTFDSYYDEVLNQSVPVLHIGFSQTVNGKFMAVDMFAKLGDSTPTDDLGGKTFPLTSESFDNSYATFTIDDFDNLFRTNTEVNGELRITFHNRELHFLVGFFQYDCVDNEGNVIAVRNGKFDMSY